VSDVASPNEALRRTLGTSSDPRVERTRASIAAAVADLSREGADITVAALVRRANISRASFYAHYSGVDELGASLMREAFTAMTAEFENDPVHDGPGRFIRSHGRLVDFFVANQSLYRAVAALPVSKDGYLSGVRLMAGLIERVLTTYPEAGDREATARYIAGAAYGLIDAWLTGEVELTRDELVERLTSLLPPWFSGIE
jgi:AcrR family transcriptional regulator